jgi:KDO2-lipid IV(A) lauroyltransferase
MAYRLDKKHRLMAVNNLKMAFPDKSEQQINELSLKVFENLGLTLFDYSRLPVINRDNFKSYFEFEGMEYVDEAIDKKKGILFITAHLCCWEMLSVCSFLYGALHVVAKDIHNSYIDAYVKELRGKNNVSVIPARNSIKEIIKILKNGGFVYTLMDQYTKKHEAELVDFFGRKAATGYFPALLALKLDMTVIPTFIKRTGECKYKVSYMSPFEIIKTKDRKKDTRDNTQVFTKLIEDEIRKNPEDWFWVHNRWKGA